MLCCGMIKRNEKRPMSDVTINGTKINCLWDSGADITVCSYATWRKLKNRPMLMRYNHGLSTANGGPIQVRGYAKLRLKIGNYECYHETVVLDDLRTDFIIGVDLMEKHNYTLDIGNKKIKRSMVSINGILDKPGYDIQSPRNFRLEPLQVASIQVKPPLAMRNKPPGTKFLVSGEWIPDGLCEIEKDSNGTFAKLVICNKTVLPVNLSRGEAIGHGEEVLDTQTVNELVTNGASLRDGQEQQHKKGEVIKKKRIIPEDMINKACENVPTQYKSQFANLLQKYSDVFSINSDEIGKCGVIKSRIDLKDKDEVVARPPYRVPHHLSAVVDIYVTKLLKQGVIRKSTSAFSSPLMLVKKPGAFDKNKSLIEQWRIVQDYRLLNKNTIKMRYPINHIHDLLNKVAQGSYFSVLDLASGFWNQEMDEDCKKYTAFSVPSLGHFEWNRTSQGLSNSGPYFQKLLDFLISGIGNTYVYIDDVIITSADLDGNLKTLETVLARFRKYGLKCRINKVKLCARTVNYLGFEINGTTGIRPAELKTKAIRDFPEPNTITQIKSWLGLTSFFRRVIPNFSEIARPLTMLTRKDSGYTSGKITPEASESFRILKDKLSSRPCVRPIKFDRDFIVTIDSSATGTGIILSQLDNEGVEHPCLFASKTNSEPESRRSALKIESEGIIYGMRTLSPIIKGGHCVIRSDHRPLISLDKTSTPILDRIHAELEEFSYEMVYIKGTSMPADALSRVPSNDHSNCLLCTRDSKGLNIISSTVPPPNDRLVSHRREILTLTQLQPAIKETSLISGLSRNQIEQLQRDDHLCKAILCWLRYDILPNSYELRTQVLKTGANARIEDGLVGIIQNGQFQILAPRSLRETLSHLAHDHHLSGHLGVRKTLDRLTTWFWPEMTQDIKHYISSCVKCNRSNPPGAYTKMPLRTLPQTIRMGQRIHLDLIGPYSHSGELNYKYALVMCDSYTSYIKVVPLVSKEASIVATAFINSWVTSLGIPEQITVDQGSEYTAKLFRELCKILHIDLKYINVNHAQANAQIERQNRNILTYIRKYIEENEQSWSAMLNHISFAMNTSIHADKNKSPFEMLYARRPITVTNYIQKKYSDDSYEKLLDRHFVIVQQVREDRKEAFLRHKVQFDKRANEKNYVVGDCIYIGHMQKKGMHRKFQPIFDGPFLVTKNLSYDAIQAEHMVTGKRIVAHKNRTKPGSANQQVWQEAGKVDLNIPPPLPTSPFGAVHPALVPSGAEEGVIKCYGSAGEENDSEAEVDGHEQNANSAYKFAIPNAVSSQAPNGRSAASDNAGTRGYFGPMTRARQRERLKNRGP